MLARQSSLMIYELGAPSVAASIQPGQELLVLLGFSGLLANFAIPLPWSAPRPSSPRPHVPRPVVLSLCGPGFSSVQDDI